jgi:hypothetical protein
MSDPFKKDSEGLSFHNRLMMKVIDLILGNGYLREEYGKYANDWFSIDRYKVLTPENKEEFEAEESRCMNSFIFEFDFATVYPPLNLIIDNFKSSFSEREIEHLKTMGRGTLYAVFEIEYVVKGVGFIMRDISTGHRYRVMEFTASYQVKPGMLNLARILQTKKDEWVIIYSDGVIVDPDEKKDFESFFSKFHENFRLHTLKSQFVHEYICRMDDDGETQTIKKLKLAKKERRNSN